MVVPFDDEDEAVAIANGTEFGLYDYVFTGDTARAMRVAKQLRIGQRRHQHRCSATTRRRSAASRCSGVGRDGGVLGPPRLQRAAVASSGPADDRRVTGRH